MYALLLGTVALIIIPDEYLERFESITGEEKEGHSKDKRIEILNDAWVIFTENPAGVGVASFPAVRIARFGREQDTHNLYLEVATNLGIQGLVVFLFLVTAMLTAYRRSHAHFLAQRKQIWPQLRNRLLPKPLRRSLYRHDRELQFLMAVCIACEGFIFVRLVLGFFGMDLYEVYWWFGAGMAIVLLNLTGLTGRNSRWLLQECETSVANLDPQAVR